MLIFRSSLMWRKSVTEPMAMDRVGRRALHACSSTESAPEGFLSELNRSQLTVALSRIHRSGFDPPLQLVEGPW